MAYDLSLNNGRLVRCGVSRVGRLLAELAALFPSPRDAPIRREFWNNHNSVQSLRISGVRDFDGDGPAKLRVFSSTDLVMPSAPSASNYGVSIEHWQAKNPFFAAI